MNKIFNINLGGYPFTIDEDAYQRLNSYLKTIERHFSKSEGYEDIISDIEGRIAELFNEQLKGQPIVSMREVEGAIKTMGTPEDFGAEAVEDEPIGEIHTGTTYKTGRRLYRDSDDKVIGGVCAGLASYFGFQDPVWLRIATVLLFFITGGSIIVVYFILYAIVPEAKTSADKLAMRGKPINVSSIARTVEEELETLGDTLNDISKEFSSKKKVLELPPFQRVVPLRKGFQF